LQTPTYTPQQGQYLAFIHAYTSLNGQPPAVADIARYFQVAPPSAQAMVKALERHGLITKQPGAARSIRVALDVSDIPCIVCRGQSVRIPVGEY